jgi:hypothetical protein
VVAFARPGLKRSILAGQPPAWVTTDYRAPYIIAVALSVPPWVSKGDLAMLGAWAKVMTLATGTRHVVDHIVPIRHPLVCGLTVPWNLQVVPWRVNAAKGNRWEPRQLELF